VGLTGQTQFENIFQAEAVKGEKAAYFLRWVVVSLLIPAAVLMLIAGRYVESLPYSFLLIGVAVGYNLMLTVFYRRGRLDMPWVKYVSVSIDISLITANQYIASVFSEAFAVTTFSTILLYPVFILYATLRHDRRLVIYTTLFSLVVFNLSYALRYPYLSPELMSQIPSTDPMGQLYKSLYITLFGFSLLLVPRTIRNLIEKQAGLLTQKMQNEMAMKLQAQREQQLTENLYKYVSKEVAEKLLKDPQMLRGKTAHITVLFVDIRGFTTYCSTRSESEILDFLNFFYDTVAGCIKAHRGLINKFLGDSVFAIFGAPDEFENTEQKAIRACKEIRALMSERREEFKSRFGIDLHIGIGIESGQALVGNVGSSDHIEYTALGDVVNMASRYEKLNKRFRTGILFSKSVKEAIESLKDVELQDLGEHEVRGAEGKRPFYTIKDFD
jgi:class 3 adenylate cyclase